MDLAEFDTTAACDRGADIELKHPSTGEGLSVFFKVVGRDSTIFRQHMKAAADKRIKEQIQAAKRGKEVPAITADETEEKAIDLLTKCTLGWYTVNDDETRVEHFTYKGESLSFSVGNAERIFREQLWIRRQIDEAVGELANFI